MKKKKVISVVNFSQDLVHIFTVYVKCLEDYFNEGENIQNHFELYSFYKQLDANIKNAVKKNGVLENE